MRYLSNFEPDTEFDIQEAVLRLPAEYRPYFSIQKNQMPPDNDPLSPYDYEMAQGLWCIACFDSTPKEIEEAFWESWLGNKGK